MPTSYRIDKEKGRVTSWGEGAITWDDIVGHMESLKTDPDFKPTFSQLIDFSKATRIELSHDQVFELAKRTLFAKGSRRAFVASSPIAYGLSRMYQSYRKMFGAETIHIFTDRGEATQWLDHEAQPKEPAKA
jgi:hypothetical protein